MSEGNGHANGNGAGHRSAAQRAVDSPALTLIYRGAVTLACLLLGWNIAKFDKAIDELGVQMVITRLAVAKLETEIRVRFGQGGSQ